MDLEWYLNSLSKEDRRRLRERVNVDEVKRQAQANALTNGWINLALWQAYYRMGTNLNGANSSNTPAQDVLFALRHVEPDLTESGGMPAAGLWLVGRFTMILSSPWNTLFYRTSPTPKALQYCCRFGRRRN